jgi:hypothetical protein
MTQRRSRALQAKVSQIRAPHLNGREFLSRFSSPAPLKSSEITEFGDISALFFALTRWHDGCTNTNSLTGGVAYGEPQPKCPVPVWLGQDVQGLLREAALARGLPAEPVNCSEIPDSSPPGSGVTCETGSAGFLILKYEANQSLFSELLVGSSRGSLPETPTDPDVRNCRIRLFGTRFHYVTGAERMRGCGKG